MTKNQTKKTVLSQTKTKKTQDDIVYEHIFEAVLEQRLAPGTKLNEESLGEIFSVSRTIIRRALSRLGHEQVVELRPNKGAIVAMPTASQARKIVRARRVIEQAVIELVIENITAQQLTLLTESVKREQAYFDNADRGAGIRQSGEFHLLLAQIADNPPLLSFQRSLVSQCSLIIGQYEQSPQSHCSYDEHFQLIAAIKLGDQEAATALMSHHLDHIENKLSLDEQAGNDNYLKSVFSDVVDDC